MSHRAGLLLFLRDLFSLCCPAGFELLGSSDPPTLASQVAGTTCAHPCICPSFLFLFLGGGVDRVLLCCPGWSAVMAHCNLELSSSDPPTSAFSVAGITRVCYHTRLIFYFCRDGVLLCCPGCPSSFLEPIPACSSTETRLHPSPSTLQARRRSSSLGSPVTRLFPELGRPLLP